MIIVVIVTIMTIMRGPYRDGIFLVIYVGIIPDCLDKDLENRIEVWDENEKSDKEEPKDEEREHLKERNRNIGEDGWDDERKDDKGDHREERPNIDKDECKIEMKRGRKVIERHAYR